MIGWGTGWGRFTYFLLFQCLCESEQVVWQLWVKPNWLISLFRCVEGSAALLCVRVWASVASGPAVCFCQCWIDCVLQTLHSSLECFSLFFLSLAVYLLLSPPRLLSASPCWLRLTASLPPLCLIVFPCITVQLSSLSSDQTVSSYCVCIYVCIFWTASLRWIPLG